MDYAKKSLNLFSPSSLSNISHRCVSASASVLPSFSPRPKPFRVTNSDRSLKKGIMADGLRDLLNKLTTVRASLHKQRKRGTVVNLPRSGPLTKITPRAQRLIQEVTKDPTTTSKELQASLASVKVSVLDATIRKRLGKNGLHGRVPRHKPVLSKINIKTMDAFHVSCIAGLVLDEDGTGVDSEDFFHTLKDSTVLMVLEKGQKWTAHQISPPVSQVGERKTKHRKDLAKLTLDFYKNHPKEFIGCLNVQMTLYGMYSMSYDLQCYHAKRMLRIPSVNPPVVGCMVLRA
ncbi:hypothetical protein NFI96_014940 [Prochilodus magdalenae]|nr:hypothetical protein NFI96_014940 [Prochilodus magdalenae]